MGLFDWFHRKSAQPPKTETERLLEELTLIETDRLKSPYASQYKFSELLTPYPHIVKTAESLVDIKEAIDQHHVLSILQRAEKPYVVSLYDYYLHQGRYVDYRLYDESIKQLLTYILDYSIRISLNPSATILEQRNSALISHVLYPFSAHILSAFKERE